MEFKLNKVDPEVRQRVKETTSGGKVHTKSNIFIRKDDKDKQGSSSNNFSKSLKKYKKNSKGNKTFSVKAVKIDEVKVAAYKEEVSIFSTDEDRGSHIDVKK